MEITRAGATSLAKRVPVWFGIVSIIGASFVVTTGSVSGATSVAPPTKCSSYTTIKMGTTPYQDSLIMAVGEQFGWYKEACLNVSFTNTAWENAMSTLASGSVNVSWYNTTGVVSTYNTDPNLVFVYPWDIFDQGAAIMARPSLHLKTFAQYTASGLSTKAATLAVLKELKGKSAIVSVGGDTGEDLTNFLDNNGKPASWMKVINLGQNPGLAAFLGGTGDVYIGGIPQRQTLVGDKYTTLITGSDVTPAPLNGFVTTRSFWNAHKSAFLALMNVTFMELRYTEAHTNQVGAYVSKLYNQQTGATLTEADFVSFFQHWEHYPLDAAQTQTDIFSSSGFGSWQKIWDTDNHYLVDVTHTLTKKVPTSAFLGVAFQKLYVATYGAHQTGWWKAGKL